MALRSADLVDDPHAIDWERWRINDALKYGAGGFGATYGALDSMTGENCAVKVQDTRPSSEDYTPVEQIRKECDGYAKAGECLLPKTALAAAASPAYALR